MKRQRRTPLLQGDLVKEALKQSFVKLDPRILFRNPVMFTVEIGTFIMLIVCLFILAGNHSQGSFPYNVTIFLILVLTLLFANFAEALAEARGIPYTGDKSCIFVIRGSIQKPKIYQLNWEHVLHLPNDSLLLMPGDIVYVASKPITEWNRFISQLLPSFSGLEIATRGAGSVGVLVP